MSEIRVNNILNAAGSGEPTFPQGFQVAAGMGITGGGNIVATAGTFSGALTAGAISGSTGTFSGAVNVDATTDSTSATSGALIVDGGLGVAKNVYIGAGLSVAGTLTYEDVTSVDSVGLITAQGGVNISGGQLAVGVAYSVGNAGVCTAAGFVGPLTGAVTGNVTGNASGSALNVTQAAQTAITSLGTLTGLTVNGATSVAGGGEFKVGTGVTIASTSGVATFMAGVYHENTVYHDDGVISRWGADGDLQIRHDGSHSYIEDTGTGNLYIEASTLNIMNAAGSEYMAGFTENGSASLFYDNSNKVETSYEGVRVSGMMSASAGIAVTGGMWEGAFIKAGKLSDNLQIGISTSNIHVFTTTETTTATPNIRWDDTYALSSKMKVGDAVTVTIVTTAAAAGYAAAITVDGNAVTEEWNGGSAPSAGGAGGYDVYTYTLIRKAAGTGDTGWITLANVSNFA